MVLLKFITVIKQKLFWGRYNWQFQVLLLYLYQPMLQKELLANVTECTKLLSELENKQVF